MPQDKTAPLKIESVLSRDLGLSAALAIGVGTMIAAGIFTLSGLAIRNVGSAAILAFLLAAFVALITALTYCEFVSIYPESGEGYLYTRSTFKAPVAYLVGWALFLGYTSSCAFYLSSLSSYFNEFVVKLPIEAAAGVVALILLTLLNIKGTKESGRFQIVVTLAKVILLLWFITGGLSSVDMDIIVAKFSTDIVTIAQTSAMVFITFFGFSAIAASAGEIKDPIVTIPRAIFISVALVTFLYTLVILVVVAAGLTVYDEAAMGNAAKQFLGPIGGYVIIGGALFSMVSAANASIMAGSRVMLSMAQLGQFPAEFAAVNKKTRTPIVSLLLVGLAILLFSISFRLEDMAHFADAVVLFVLVIVNGALIVHRRKYPEIERPFKVPLVPLLPALGIISNAYLLFQISHHPFPLLMAVASLILGFVGFFAWKGLQADEELLPGARSRVALERSVSDAKHDFSVLVPLANPENVPLLMELACAIARDRKGKVVTLRVAVVPEQLPLSHEETYIARERKILEQAHTAALEYEVPVTSMVRVGHNAARAILETARERNCDLIVLGWRGYSSTKQKILGETVDDVVTHARADVMLVKPNGIGSMNNFLLPTVGGEHAECAADYISSLVRARGGELTMCSVVPPESPAPDNRLALEKLDGEVKRIKDARGVGADTKLIHNRSISAGVIQEAREYDAVVVGASRRSIYPQIIFGNIPETIAKRTSKPVILFKHHHPVKSLIGRVVGEDS
ncbi:MAG: amino acid permease [Cyanobacteria bacterium HKST-UBA01]|nr:amino acid permease [Cyanobacteria bacterium HKST-UBA01]